MTNQHFLHSLQAQAAQQAKLSQQRWLPASVDWFTSFVGTYPWQVGLVLSGCISLIIEVTK
jgi:hypothetical protein